MAAQYLQQLQHQAIAKEAQKLQKRLPDLLNFLHRAKPIIKQLEKQYGPWYLKMFCAAWQTQKNLIKAKSAKPRQYFKQLTQGQLLLIKQIQPALFEQHHTHIFQQLDNIVQSSAMVETINSIIRPYLNTAKNNVSQHLLNLIMFYHNNRIYRDGKRKGKSPLQILLKKDTQEDWIELLFEHIVQNMPDYFAQE